MAEQPREDQKLAPIRWLPSEADTRAGRARLAFGGLAAAVALGLAGLHLASGSSRAHISRYRVSSGSMLPTLAVGQVVEVDTSAYASSPPRVGDIVAFHAPSGAVAAVPLCGVATAPGQVCARSTLVESDQVFIKRVVAGPGDSVAVVDGAVVRNGTLEIETFPTRCSDGTGCNFPTAVRVPAGDWFLMGDNRGRSDDSRYWGPVPGAWIIGRVVG